MIDTERLLGKIITTAISGKSGVRGRRERKSDDLLGGVLSGLTSGKGLLAAIGLGVGAFEILKNQSSQTASSNHHSSVQPPPPTPQQGMTTPPPPPIPGSDAKTPTESTAEMEASEKQSQAIRLIQAMVAAAHADNRLDLAEEEKILEKIQEQDVNQEEMDFLLDQLHNPRPIEELTRGIDTLALGQVMYSLAVSTIVIDTDQERKWLDELALSLGLSEEIKRFIEQDL